VARNDDGCESDFPQYLVDGMIIDEEVYRLVIDKQIVNSGRVNFRGMSSNRITNNPEQAAQLATVGQVDRWRVIPLSHNAPDKLELMGEIFEAKTDDYLTRLVMAQLKSLSD
jgi:hypothetical protein